MTLNEYEQQLTVGHMGDDATEEDLAAFRAYLRRAYRQLLKTTDSVPMPETEWEWRVWSDSVFEEWCSENGGQS